jgi:hypothetical protein
MRARDSTVPCCSNSERISVSVAEKGRLPTKILVICEYTHYMKNNHQPRRPLAAARLREQQVTRHGCHVDRKLSGWA